MRRMATRIWIFAITIVLLIAAVPAFAQAGEDLAPQFAMQDREEGLQTESFQFEIPEAADGSRAFIGGGPSFWGAFLELDQMEQALNDVSALTATSNSTIDRSICSRAAAASAVGGCARAAPAAADAEPRPRARRRPSIRQPSALAWAASRSRT